MNNILSINLIFNHPNNYIVENFIDLNIVEYNDSNFFKDKTMYNILIMDYNTFINIDKNLLKDKISIIVDSQNNNLYKYDGIKFVTSIDDAIKIAEQTYISMNSLIPNHKYYNALYIIGDTLCEWCLDNYYNIIDEVYAPKYNFQLDMTCKLLS